MLNEELRQQRMEFGRQVVGEEASVGEEKETAFRGRSRERCF